MSLRLIYPEKCLSGQDWIVYNSNSVNIFFAEDGVFSKRKYFSCKFPDFRITFSASESEKI